MTHREEYFPFGETAFGSYGKKRYRFCGKERDEESGLYYYGARYYMPWQCRFVSVDPLAGEYPFYTPYQYAGNRPVIAIDLDGLEEYLVNSPVLSGELIRALNEAKSDKDRVVVWQEFRKKYECVRMLDAKPSSRRPKNYIRDKFGEYVWEITNDDVDYVQITVTILEKPERYTGDFRNEGLKRLPLYDSRKPPRENYMMFYKLMNFLLDAMDEGTINSGHIEGEYSEEKRPNVDYGIPFYKDKGYDTRPSRIIWGFEELMESPYHISNTKLEMRAVVQGILENGVDSYPGSVLKKDYAVNEDDPHSKVHPYVLSFSHANENGRQVENIVILSKEQYQKIENANHE